MIQISDTRYISKYQILEIVKRYDNFEIYMITGERYCVYRSSIEYYQNIKCLLEGK